MQKVSFIFQIFFKLFIIFLIVFVWVRFFVKSFVACILISAILTAIIDVLTRLFFKRQHTKLSQKQKEKEDAENMFLSLVTGKNELSFFSKLLKAECSLKRDYVIYNKEKEKVIIFPFLSFAELTINDISSIMKKVKKVQTYI